jgi:threonine/homoserine/homoserine lactone efflux protein
VRAFVLAGLLLGLSSGLSPGPLLTLVVHETLHHGRRAGLWIAVAPLLTDLPIIGVTVLLLQPLASRQMPLALINLGGGLYLAWLGLHSIRFRGADIKPTRGAGALQRGVIANFLNPNPYLFWLAVGTPTLLDAWDHSWMAAAGFIATFYSLLVGSKVLLAVGLGYCGGMLQSDGYIAVIRGLGLLLLGYALVFLTECWQLLQAAGLI